MDVCWIWNESNSVSWLKAPGATIPIRDPLMDRCDMRTADVALLSTRPTLTFNIRSCSSGDGNVNALISANRRQ